MSLRPPLELPADADDETLRVHLETLWHLSAEEIAKTDALERKAAAIGSLAGLVVAVNGAFGLDVVRAEGGWPQWAYLLSFPLLLGAVWFAALAIRPTAKHRVFDDDHIRGLEEPPALLLKPSAARLQTIDGVIERVLAERGVVAAKKDHVERAFGLFLGGLALVAIEASALAARLGT
jgi:hypothetical protein